MFGVCRCHGQVTIILAGYQDDIEKKLFAFNLGLASRFETIQFEDFTYDQLHSIWRNTCTEQVGRWLTPHRNTFAFDFALYAVVHLRVGCSLWQPIRAVLTAKGPFGVVLCA